MRKIMSLVIVLTLTFGVMLTATFQSGSMIVFAQRNQTNASSSTSPSNQTSPLPTKTLHKAKVKITSLTRDQQVPVGKDLTVSGTSIDNATSNDCKVTVILNNVRPYQPVTPSGAAAAAGDYSKWNFVLTSKYTTIKPGQNRITAKYDCTDNPALNSFSSVNVTGIQAVTAKASSSPSSTNQTKPSPPPSMATSTVG